MYLYPILLMILGASHWSLASPPAACSSGIYEALLILSNYPPAESYCSQHYPLPVVTVTAGSTVAKRGYQSATKKTTTTTTTTTKTTTTKPSSKTTTTTTKSSSKTTTTTTTKTSSKTTTTTTKPSSTKPSSTTTTTSANSQASLWSSLEGAAASIIQTACSCIETAKTVTITPSSIPTLSTTTTSTTTTSTITTPTTTTPTTTTPTTTTTTTSSDTCGATTDAPSLVIPVCPTISDVPVCSTDDTGYDGYNFACNVEITGLTPLYYACAGSAQECADNCGIISGCSTFQYDSDTGACDLFYGCPCGDNVTPASGVEVGSVCEVPDPEPT